jgi:hypothetical protein
MDSAKTDKYGIGIKRGDGKIWNMFDFQNHYLFKTPQ